LIGLLTLTAAAADLDPSIAASALKWRLVGPFRGGRTRAVTGIPGQPDTYLIGAVNGGVWKTTDSGRTWVPIFDAMPTQSIGAIAVAPSDPRIMYVASGEGLLRPDLSVGNGVYRSSDSGRTWTHVGLTDAQQIPELAIDPKDPNRLFAAVLGHPFGASPERGIYRSTDGGKSWNRILYVSDDTGGSFVKLDPKDSNVLYAGLWNVRAGPWEDNNIYNGTAGGLFKSVDGGDHWRRLTQGLPENLSQIDVAVAPSNSNRLYATVGTSTEGDYSSAAGLGVYRSDDGGESWVCATTDPRPALRIGGGDLPLIKVDPHNADVLYSASIVAEKSTDGGAHWSSWRGSPGGDDYQNLWISPDDPNHIAMVSDQGGIITLNGGATWSSWLNQPTAQLYHIGVTNTYPYRLCSGQQESGSVCITSRGNDGEVTDREWHPVGVIEYGYAIPDPLDADIVFGSGRNEVTKTHLSTGEVQDITPLPIKGPLDRFDRTEPLFFSPQDPHLMYYAANRLYATTDGGQSWRTVSPDLTREDPGVPASVGALRSDKAAKQRGAIYAASASPLQQGLLWAGTDDGLIWVTHDAGTHWSNVTPPAMTAWSKVTQIDASHADPEVAYVSVSRFRIDDLRPYIYRTRDGGRTWALITAGLANDAPVNTVREDPSRPGLLFAGTENAVWVSWDDGDHWRSLQLNLPHTSMRDLAVHGQDLIVATHGRSFWVLDDIGPLRQFGTAMQSSEATLLTPSPAVRVKRSTGSDTPLQPDEPTGQNPPAGAVIDYYLPRDAKTAVSLEILDSTGAVVRRVSSADPPEFSQEKLARELIPLYWIRITPPLATTSGMHRWVWDLHYAAPRTVQRGFPISAVPGDTPQEPMGPAAPPGSYQVRLYFGDHHWDAPLVVSADPRAHTSAAEFAAQFTAARRIAAALDESTGALLGVQSLRAQVKELSPRTAGLLATQLSAFDSRAATLVKPDVKPAAPDQAPPPGLERVNGSLATLYGQISGADTAPTAAQTRETERAVTNWENLKPQWQELRTQVLNINRDLKKHHLPVLTADSEPPRDLDFADED
jgi:photosystem II stability/assembly factor-like uncharacterized protein